MKHCWGPSTLALLFTRGSLPDWQEHQLCCSQEVCRIGRRMEEQEQLRQEALLREHATRLHVLVSTAVCPGILKSGHLPEVLTPSCREPLSDNVRAAVGTYNGAGKMEETRESGPRCNRLEDQIKEFSLAVVSPLAIRFCYRIRSSGDSPHVCSHARSRMLADISAWPGVVTWVSLDSCTW